MSNIEKIEDKASIIRIEDQMKEAYLDYAMSVIIGRALPDARDGLKPVHRRILYAMYDMGCTHDKPYKKSARVVGDVIGKYHPHGDMAVYDALVRMAQDFSMRYKLIEGQGNFGSIDGDPPAAMRYTEARLNQIAEKILTDIDMETVDFGPNYDDSTTEPLVLPAVIPNLLVNGSSGIAVGMATNIPPHNLRDVTTAIKTLIKNPETTIDELINIIKGPDFPTGAFIYGSNGIKEAYSTGKGIILIRANATIEEIKADRQAIIVTEIPYQVNKSKLIEEVAELIKDRRIDGISDIRDESDRTGMRIVFELKKGENSQTILNQLFKNTQLETSFGITMLALDNKQPKLMNIKELLLVYLNHRKEVVTRRTNFLLKQNEEKLHILEAIKKAVENLDNVLNLIKSAKDPETAKNELCKKYDLTEKQSKAILDIRLQRLTSFERDNIITEHRETTEKIKELKEILSDENKILGIIENELDDIDEKFGDERKTRIVIERENLTVEDFIVDEPMVVTVTVSGYIKRLPVATYRSQRRGGKGVIGAGTGEEDFIKDVFVASTHNYILVFTSFGKCYWLKVHQIPEGGRTARGKSIVNLLNISENEKIQAVLPVEKLTEENRFIVMATENGIVKKTALNAFSHPMRKGIIAINIEEGDSLVEAKLTDGKNQIVLVTKNGQSIRFPESDIRPSGRAAIGVRGITLHDADGVVGMEIIDVAKAAEQVLTVTELGYGKRTPIEEYRIQTRGGTGVRTMRITEKNKNVIAVLSVVDDDEIIIASNRGKVIRTKVKEISQVGRVAQGVCLINLSEGEKVGAVAKIIEKEEDS